MYGLAWYDRGDDDDGTVSCESYRPRRDLQDVGVMYLTLTM